MTTVGRTYPDFPVSSLLVPACFVLSSQWGEPSYVNSIQMPTLSWVPPGLTFSLMRIFLMDARLKLALHIAKSFGRLPFPVAHTSITIRDERVFEHLLSVRSLLLRCSQLTDPPSRTRFDTLLWNSFFPIGWSIAVHSAKSFSLKRSLAPPTTRRSCAVSGMVAR